MVLGQQGFVFEEDEVCLIQTGNLAAKKSYIFERQFLLPFDVLVRSVSIRKLLRLHLA